MTPEQAAALDDLLDANKAYTLAGGSKLARTDLPRWRALQADIERAALMYNALGGHMLPADLVAEHIKARNS